MHLRDEQFDICKSSSCGFDFDRFLRFIDSLTWHNSTQIDGIEDNPVSGISLISMNYCQKYCGILFWNNVSIAYECKSERVRHPENGDGCTEHCLHFVSLIFV